MSRIDPHVDIDTLCDALAVAMSHMYATGAIDVSEDAARQIAARTDCYEDDQLIDLFEAAAKIMARGRAAH
jgi:hypothetical protein